jgi:RimJ/RimL family protein N-acetyltransferase
MNAADAENLRIWKNTNKASFFLNGDITSEQQNAWYEAMKKRPDDLMFIVEQDDASAWTPIGCMGFRLLEDEKCVDAYNIIRAVKTGVPSFTMGDAFKTMLAFAKQKYPGQPIRCKVLTNNPAIKWYEKNGFRVRDTLTDYVLMELDAGALDGIELNIEQNQI